MLARIGAARTTQHILSVVAVCFAMGAAATAGPPQDHYFHADDLYNVTALTDGGAAEAVERHEYADYGGPLDADTLAPVGAPSAIGNALGFTGRRLDAESGFLHFRARYLDPHAGRFTGRDPARDGEGEAGLFAYVGNNPASKLDPLGLYELSDGARELRKTKEGRLLLAGDRPAAEFVGWYNLEKADMGWLSALPDCPCQIKCDGKWTNPDKTAWDDPHVPYNRDKYHPGAAMEIRSKKSYGKEGSGQQCCYDDDGALITAGLGAGTPDRKHWGSKTGAVWHTIAGGGHIGHDVDPFNRAHDLDNDAERKKVGEQRFREMYLEVRPPNPGKGGDGKPCKANKKP